MLLTIIILISKFGKEIQDIPNERSLHETPIPRIGGVAMMAGILSGWALMLTSLVWWLVLPLLGLFVVSLLDDMHSLPVKKRLLAQLVAAAVLVAGSGLFAQHGLLITLLVLLLTIWMTNLYNFMDGSDGLAGGMALFGFSFYGIAALMGLSQRNTVSRYQRRYPDMPRPVIDLGPGRPRLWLRSQVVGWMRKRGRPIGSEDRARRR